MPRWQIPPANNNKGKIYTYPQAPEGAFLVTGTGGGK